MTRPIKFRAWDGKKMHQWDSTDHGAVDQITVTPYPKLFYLPMSWLVGDSNDWVWMQFTGLHDKNGKEIWEGDVVKYEIWERFHEDKREATTAVEFNVNWAGWWPMVAHTVVDDGYYNYEIENVEIIGNIYENPELLTK